MNTQQNRASAADAVERGLSLAAGAAFIIDAVSRRSWISLITAPVGAVLLAHGSSRVPLLDQVLPAGRRQQAAGSQATEQQAAKRLAVTQSVTVNRSAQDLYEYWRNFENLPSFMQHVNEVQNRGDGLSHWRVDTPLGQPLGTALEWTAEVTDDQPGQRIAWRTVPAAGNLVDNSGWVEFTPSPTGDSTGDAAVVRAHIAYNPPGGVIGDALAALFQRVTEQQVKDDIRRFKAVMEAGEAPTVDGQPSGRN